VDARLDKRGTLATAYNPVPLPKLLKVERQNPQYYEANRTQKFGDSMEGLQDGNLFHDVPDAYNQRRNERIINYSSNSIGINTARFHWKSYMQKCRHCNQEGLIYFHLYYGLKP
jgi:hypothetical protein